MMRIASENGLLVDPNSGHRPPENKTTLKRKQQKRKEVQLSDVHALPGTSSRRLQKQNSENSGCSLEPTQRLASESAQPNAVQHSHSITLNQHGCSSTTSHHIEQPAAIFMGRSYHGVSFQDVLHHYPPVTAGGRPVQQHDPWSTGQNYPRPTHASGAESWHSGYSPHRYEVVQNLLIGTEVLRTTSWSNMSTGDLFEEMSEREISFLVQITAIHIIT